MSCELRALLLIILLVMGLSIACAEADYPRVFKLPVNGKEYELTISVPDWLYDFYREKSHLFLSYKESGRFVTPDAVKPVAEVVRLYCPDDEGFANAVVAIVQQIPYTNTSRTLENILYPAETLVDFGVCDDLSILAASILKAGGVDVILLYFEDVGHVNIGVHLKDVPKGVRTKLGYVEYGGKRYYIAELTGTPEKRWRVGELPEELEGKKPAVIIPVGAEPSPGSVLCRVGDRPIFTKIDLQLPKVTVQGQSVDIRLKLMDERGEPIPHGLVRFHVLEGGVWRVVDVCRTNVEGIASTSYTFFLPGTHWVKASYAGKLGYSESIEVRKVLVSLNYLWIAGIAVGAYCIAGFFVYRRLKSISRPK